MRRNLGIFIIVLLIFAVGGFAVYRQSQNRITEPFSQELTDNPEAEAGENMLGGDRDEHGCIGSAGYTWCEEKGKCLRLFEEECEENLEMTIARLLAVKHNREVSEVRIGISKQTDGFVSGSVTFGEGGPGDSGMFLAAKTANGWELVFDGNGLPDCDLVRNVYKVPSDFFNSSYCD